MHLIVEFEPGLDLACLTEGLLEHLAIEFVEVIRIDQIVTLDAGFVLEGLVTQAQQLDEIEPFEHRIDLLVTDRQALRGDAQALDRVGVMDAGGPGVDARDIDEDPRPVFLEVDLARIPRFEIGDEIATPVPKVLAKEHPLLRYLDIAKRRPYQTRHTTATLMLASGENPEWIARLMGHANTQMLFTVYSRFVPNLTRQDGLAITGLLNSREQKKANAADPISPDQLAAMSADQLRSALTQLLAPPTP